MYANGIGEIQINSSDDVIRLLYLEDTLRVVGFTLERCGPFDFEIEFTGRYKETDVLNVLNQVSGFIATGYIDFTTEQDDLWRLIWNVEKQKWDKYIGRVEYHMI